MRGIRRQVQCRPEAATNWTPKALGSALSFWVRGDMGITLANLGLPNGSAIEGWTLRQVTIPITNGSDPLGGTSARKMLADGTNNTHYAYAAATDTWPVGTRVSVSIYLKYIDSQWVWVGTSNGTVYVDVLNGAIGTVVGGMTPTITAVGGGWYQVSWTRAETALDQFIQCGLANGNGSIGPMITSGSFWIYDVELVTPVIGGWADQSGSADANKNMVANSNAERPAYWNTDTAYNSKPIVRFGGATWLKSAIWATANPQPFTAFVVGEDSATGGIEVYYETGSNLAGGNRQIMYNNSGALSMDAGANLSFEVQLAGPHMIGNDWNTAQSRAYDESTLDHGLGNAGANTGAAAIFIGATYLATAKLNGKIAEVIVFNRLLTDDERIQVYQYLSLRYGISSARTHVHAPTGIKSCTAWYRGDLGITLNGSTVATWSDQSGDNWTDKDLTQAVAANQPTFVASSANLNNQPTLRFDGANPGDYMETVGGFHTWDGHRQQVYTWFCVFYLDNTYTAANPYVFDSKLSAQSGLHQQGAATQMKHFAGVDAVVGAGYVPDNKKTAVVIIPNAAVGKSSVNSKTLSTNQNFGTNEIHGGICIGNYSDGNGSGAFAFKGEIAELAVFTRELTQTEINTLMDYAAARYNITLV